MRLIKNLTQVNFNKLFARQMNVSGVNIFPRTILLMSFMLFHVGLFGQRPNLQLGLIFGTNASIINQKLVELDPGVGAGFQGGFYFRVTKLKLYGEVGMNFIRQTAFLSINSLDSLIAEENGIRLFKTEFPIIIGYKPVKTPLIKWRLFSGFSPTVIGKVFDDNELGYDKKQWTNPNVSWRLGTGIDIAFFTLDFNYSVEIVKSLRRVFRTQGQLFQFNFGVIF